MFEAAKNAWKIADLRKKILYTLFIVILFRLGSVIPVPFIDGDALVSLFNSTSSTLGDPGGVFNFLNIMAGGALSKASIFAMSIGPYVTASIIMQLLAVAIPALERLQKEGEEGRKKLAQITRYVTIAIGFLEGYAYYAVLKTQTGVIASPHWFKTTVIIMSFAAGTALIMWMGEKINENGIGNGISIILFASIVSSGPNMIVYIYQGIILAEKIYLLPLVLLVAIAIIVLIVIMSDAERRIPIQYAKRVVGRKMYGGQSTHLPLKVSMTGVMPIIFANSFVMLPSTIAAFFPNSGVANFFTKYFSYTTWPYAIVYFLLIIFFNYFYVTIQYNPVEIANNIKKNGGFIPGIRPGDPTSDFIQKVLNKITMVGAIFLGLVAVVPILLNIWLNINIALGGTSVLIVVGVILETMKQLESQIMMRHYKGFLE